MKGTRIANRDAAYPVRKDAAGNRLCRWDQKPVAQGRRNYCSEQCAIEVDIRTSGSSLRYHIKQRDKGVCAACGLDTERLERIAEHAKRSLYEIKNGIGATKGWWSPHTVRSIDVFFMGFGFNRNQSFWEADHIVELVNGGETSLENTQTLCVPCHKAKTKQMHADRKHARTGIKPRSPVQETQLRLSVVRGCE